MILMKAILKMKKLEIKELEKEVGKLKFRLKCAQIKIDILDTKYPNCTICPTVLDAADEIARLKREIKTIDSRYLHLQYIENTDFQPMKDEIVRLEDRYKIEYDLRCSLEYKLRRANGTIRIKEARNIELQKEVGGVEFRLKCAHNKIELLEGELKEAEA